MNINCFRRIVKECCYCREEIKENWKTYGGKNFCERCWKASATMICVVCEKSVPSVFIDPETKKRYCDDCWKVFKANKPNIEGIMKTCTGCGKSVYYGESVDGLFKCLACSTVKKDNVVGIGSWMGVANTKLEKCIACKSLCSLNAGDFLQGEFICDGCMQDNEGKEIHVKIKVRGSAKMTAFWHWVITQCDSDWPFLKQAKDRQECPKCGGLVYKNPLLEVKEIKTLAEECKVGKVKVKFWGTKEECEGGKVNAA